jgi:hypothetical protein
VSLAIPGEQRGQGTLHLRHLLRLGHVQLLTQRCAQERAADEAAIAAMHHDMVDRALMTRLADAPVKDHPQAPFQYLLACYRGPMPGYGPPTAGAVACRH